MPQFLDINIDITTALLFLVVIVSFASGFFVYRRARHRTSSKYYALVSFTIGLWVLGRAIFQTATVEGTASFWGYFLFIPPVFVVLFLLLFCIYVGQEDKRLSIWQKIIIYIPWSVLLFVAVAPGQVVERVKELPNGANDIVYGGYFLSVYGPLLVIYLISIFPILIIKYKRVNHIVRLQLRYILLGTFMSIAIAVVANIILPAFGYTNLVWLGPLSAIILVVVVGYAVSRKELWDFKLIFTELLVFLILVVQLTQIFLTANEPNKLIFHSATFVFMAIFSAFLIRGIFREVESGERVAELTEELTVVNRRLQEIDIEKSDFVSIASHQLRAPLTLIKGYASMFLEGSFGPIEDENKKNIIQKIYDASERLVAMIEDFLDISRIEEGKLSYYFEKVNMSNFLDDVMGEAKQTIREDEYTITVHIEPELYTIADKLKLRQVVANLLDNAMKYSPKGTSIDIKLTSSLNKILLSIKDSGIGIPKKTVARLFKKFSRGDVFSKLQTEGRGLGLYIARQIMTAHGGKIWLESAGEGMGTTAFLEFQEFVPDEHRKEIKQFVKDVAT